MKYFLLFVCLLCGCSPVPMDEAKQAAIDFHEYYQRGKYDEIYSMTSDDFKQSTPEQAFINFMVKAKEEDLGAFKKTTHKLQKNTHSLFSSNEISLVYYSEYTKRIVQEIFTFEVDDGKIRLKNYRYDSIN